MCQHVARGHWMQGRGDVSVDLGHQVGRARRSLGQSRKDLVFACLSMRDQPAQPLSRVRDCFAVTRQKLREALIEGENSGPSSGLDIEAFIASKKKSFSL